MDVIEHVLDPRTVAVELIPPSIDGFRHIAVSKEDAATNLFEPRPNETADSKSTSN